MFFKYRLPFLPVFVCGFNVLAKPLEVTKTQALVLPELQNLTNSIFASDLGAGTSTSTISTENAFNIQCNGALYGFNPNVADCENAAQTINPDSDQMTWGERHTGLPRDIFILPFAVFGGRGEPVWIGHI